MTDFITATNLADILGVSNRTVETWIKSGKLYLEMNENGQKGFNIKQLFGIPIIDTIVNNNWDEELHVKPLRKYNSIELFAGGGGLALGMEMAGFHHIMLNEFDHIACETLRHNRPEWNVIEGDIHNISFKEYEGKVDFLSGGFPCQAFSYAGNRGGFSDTRGTLFFEMARAISECKPKVFMGENVKGLLTHDNGKTITVIRNTIKELGYTLIEPQVLKAILYQVPQKRERLILIAVRNDIVEKIAGKVAFKFPSPYERVMNLRDAFYKGVLYDCDVPKSEGQSYPKRKKEIMDMVPMGGFWKDLPIDVQKEYMKGSFALGGGKTGMARRLSLDEPSLTLTCAPAMKQTERCHPLETRPLTVREYARIQTFPDSWEFMGKMDAQYKQIGNAVPVNLAYAVGRSIIRFFNEIEKIDNKSVKENQEIGENNMSTTIKDFLFEGARIYGGYKSKSCNFFNKLEIIAAHISKLKTLANADVNSFLQFETVEGERAISSFGPKEKTTLLKIQEVINPNISIERNFIIILTQDFINTQIQEVDKIQLNDLGFNPILCRALKLDKSNKLIKFYTYAAVSRSIVTSMGTFIEKLLLYSNKDVFPGDEYEKTGTTQWDIVIERLNQVTTYIEVKSGTNTMNKKQVLAYINDINTLNNNGKCERAMIGMASGSITDDTVALNHIKAQGSSWLKNIMIGKDFWNYVADNPNYHKILLSQIQKTANTFLRNIDIVKKIDRKVEVLTKEFDEKYPSMTIFYQQIW